MRQLLVIRQTIPAIIAFSAPLAPMSFLVESLVILGAGEVFPVLPVILPLVLLGGLEHLEALPAEEKAVTLDQV